MQPAQGDERQHFRLGRAVGFRSNENPACVRDTHRLGLSVTFSYNENLDCVQGTCRIAREVLTDCKGCHCGLPLLEHNKNSTS